jgi:hypothetical protein
MNDKDWQKHLQKMLQEYDEDKHLSTLQALQKRGKNKPKKTPPKNKNYNR